jgi:hypothetical protein
VYSTQSRFVHILLKPARRRLPRNAAACRWERLTIRDWGESPTIRNGRSRSSTRYRRVEPILKGYIGASVGADSAEAPTALPPAPVRRHRSRQPEE